jgi:hypothetical protein
MLLDPGTEREVATQSERATNCVVQCRLPGMCRIHGAYDAEGQGICYHCML